MDQRCVHLDTTLSALPLGESRTANWLARHIGATVPEVHGWLENESLFAHCGAPHFRVTVNRRGKKPAWFYNLSLEDQEQVRQENVPTAHGTIDR